MSMGSITKAFLASVSLLGSAAGAAYAQQEDIPVIDEDIELAEMCDVSACTSTTPIFGLGGIGLSFSKYQGSDETASIRENFSLIASPKITGELNNGSRENLGIALAFTADYSREYSDSDVVRSFDAELTYTAKVDEWDVQLSYNEMIFSHDVPNSLTMLGFGEQTQLNRGVYLSFDSGLTGAVYASIKTEEGNHTTRGRIIAGFDDYAFIRLDESRTWSDVLGVERLSANAGASFIIASENHSDASVHGLLSFDLGSSANAQFVQLFTSADYSVQDNLTVAGGVSFAMGGIFSGVSNGHDLNDLGRDTAPRLDIGIRQNQGQNTIFAGMRQTF